MSIENIAFIIPVHPPKYHYIYDLIHKLEVNHILIDIFLVFSSRQDYDIFTIKRYIKPIILEPFQTNSIVTYKKFTALKQLADSKYEYIICCDSEIDIIANNFTSDNINNKIKQIFDNKKIYAGDTRQKTPRTILQISADIFPHEYNKLKDITKDFTLYFWYSDLPVYRRVDILPFLNMLNYDNISYYHFDYMIYQYYLTLYHNFEIVNTTPITNLDWSLEHLSTTNVNILNALVDIKYGFGWNDKRLYIRNKNFIESQKGFIIYHLDRT